MTCQPKLHTHLNYGKPFVFSTSPCKNWIVTSSKNSSFVWLNSREILNHSFIYSFSFPLIKHSTSNLQDPDFSSDDTGSSLCSGRTVKCGADAAHGGRLLSLIGKKLYLHVCMTTLDLSLSLSPSFGLLILFPLFYFFGK